MKYFVGLLYLATLIALTYAGTKFEYNNNVNEDEEQELMEHKIEDNDEEMVEDFIGMRSIIVVLLLYDVIISAFFPSFRCKYCKDSCYCTYCQVW